MDLNLPGIIFYIGVRQLSKEQRPITQRKIFTLDNCFRLKRTHKSFCRDNAVYRSNSFKFERRAPAASTARPEAGQPAQSAARLEQVLASVSREKIRASRVDKSGVKEVI